MMQVLLSFLMFLIQRKLGGVWLRGIEWVSLASPQGLRFDSLGCQFRWVSLVSSKKKEGNKKF